MADKDNKSDVAKKEEEILKFWQEKKIFEKTLEQTKNGKPFTFYDGPPFANGTPHYGHLVASAMKDVIKLCVADSWKDNGAGIPMVFLLNKRQKKN
jgi:isoleucyl-tRNA synthetase